MARKFNTTKGWGRCDHRYCGDCATRRGANTGNRRFRYAGRRVARALTRRPV